LAVACACVFAWSIGRHPKDVTAERFVLTDSRGAIRGEWGPSAELAGEIDGKAVDVETTCLVMTKPGKSHASLCVPWEADGDASLGLRDDTGSQVNVIAGPHNGQVLITARATPKDRPTSLALLMASHVDSAVTLRHGKTASYWTSGGATAPSEADSSAR
jgi:hypothetical protein